MKSRFLILAIAFYSLSITAQNESEGFLIEKGSWSLGGYLNANTTRSETQFSDIENYGFNLRPEAGYFITDNLALGMQAGYGYTFYKNNESIGYSVFENNSLLIAPYLRKFLSISGSFAISFTGSLDYRRQWIERSSENCLNCSDSTVDDYAISIRPGVTYRLSNKFLLDANLGLLQYSHTDTILDNMQESTSNRFNFSMNLSSIYLGLSYLF